MIRRFFVALFVVMGLCTVFAVSGCDSGSDATVEKASTETEAEIKKKMEGMGGGQKDPTKSGTPAAK